MTPFRHGWAARDRLAWLTACVVVATASLVASVFGDVGGDYGNPRCNDAACDDPSRSLDAVLDGRIGDFFHDQPIMGLFSLLVRLPAVALARAAGGDIWDEYRAGAFVCFSLAGLIGVWLTKRAHERGAGVPACIALLAALLVAILWTNALPLGHPEEPLAAALSLAAVVAALDRRLTMAGLLLGAAIGTKEWALLAAAPVLLAAAQEWRRPAIIGLLTAAALFMPFAVGDLERFREAHAKRTRLHHSNTPANIWWKFGDRRVVARDELTLTIVVYPKEAVALLARPLVFFLSLALAILYGRRWRGRPTADVLAFLALLYVFRCVLDTETFRYHHIPMLMAIPVWEAVGRRRFPIIGIAAAIALQLTARVVSKDFGPDTFHFFYLGWTLPLVAYLAVAAARRSTSAAPA